MAVRKFIYTRTFGPIVQIAWLESPILYGTKWKRLCSEIQNKHAVSAADAYFAVL